MLRLRTGRYVILLFVDDYFVQFQVICRAIVHREVRVVAAVDALATTAARTDTCRANAPNSARPVVAVEAHLATAATLDATSAVSRVILPASARPRRRV